MAREFKSWEVVGKRNSTMVFKNIYTYEMIWAHRVGNGDDGQQAWELRCGNKICTVFVKDKKELKEKIEEIGGSLVK
jgi:hypothetical protein